MPVLIAKRVRADPGRQPCSSPGARPAATSARSSSWPTTPKTCKFARAGRRQPQIGLVARPASPAQQGREPRALLRAVGAPQRPLLRRSSPPTPTAFALAALSRSSRHHVRDARRGITAGLALDPIRAPRATVAPCRITPGAVTPTPATATRPRSRVAGIWWLLLPTGAASGACPGRPLQRVVSSCEDYAAGSPHKPHSFRVDEHCRLLVARLLARRTLCKQPCARLTPTCLLRRSAASRRTASNGPGASDGVRTRRIGLGGTRPRRVARARNAMAGPPGPARVLVGCAARSVRSAVCGVCDVVGGFDEVSV